MFSLKSFGGQPAAANLSFQILSFFIFFLRERIWKLNFASERGQPNNLRENKSERPILYVLYKVFSIYA